MAEETFWTRWEGKLQWEKFVDKNRNPIGLGIRMLAFLIWIVGLILQNVWVCGVAIAIFAFAGFFPKPYKPNPWAEKWVLKIGFRLENFVCQFIAFIIYSAGFGMHRVMWVVFGFFIAFLGVLFFRKD
ncbi:MAG: hypothetical protein NT099_03250 [Candidatus Saganbacteria bacterium]|nr:hypothetical protein [Candidatus Saganbacteria bacterium]